MFPSVSTTCLNTRHRQLFTIMSNFPWVSVHPTTDVLKITIKYILINTGWEPLLLSIGQGSWLQIQRSGFDSRRYQIVWEVVGLKRGPLSLVSTTEELLGKKISGFGLESRLYGRRNPSRWPRGTLYPQKLALTSPTSGGRSVGTVRSWTQAMEFSLV
jgi:hypothetical protein